MDKIIFILFMLLLHFLCLPHRVLYSLTQSYGF